MLFSSGLPDNESSWNTACNSTSDAKAKGQTSASKIAYEQFLQLKILWRIREAKKIMNIKTSFGLSDDILRTAHTQLNGLISWIEYLNCLKVFEILPNPLPQSLGVFALVLTHQMEVSKKVRDESEEMIYEEARYNLRPRVPIRLEAESPTKRLFQQKKQNEPQSLSTNLLDPETEAGPGALTPTTLFKFGSLSLDDSPISPQTPLAQSSALTEEMFPRAPDEQIVNTALIDLLEALRIHFPGRAEWTLHRKIFHIGEFEARVDGYLKIRGTDIVKAIVEVKAAVRSKESEKSRVRMQEGAQMAAWIYSDRLEEGCNIDPTTGRRHRILISQDRHQIFVTFASYGPAYINYLRPPDNGEAAGSKSSKIFGGLGRSEQADSKDSSELGEISRSVKISKVEPSTTRDPPFLVMEEFGPFNTEVAKDMRVLGSFILALVWQAST